MPDYKYDVFISYERDGLLTGWIIEHFLPHFRTWLRLTIADVCRRKSLPIFFDISRTVPDFPGPLKQDVAGIEPGADWDQALRDALLASRCMIGIWQPPYFLSEWCNLEWQSFDRRADDTGKRLLLGISFYDGQSFPKKAIARQSLDFSPFALFGPALPNSGAKYADFQDNVRLLAQRAAEVIRDAPAFGPWQLAEEVEQASQPPTIPITRF